MNQVMTLRRTATPTQTSAETIQLKAPEQGTVVRDALRFFRSSSYSELRTIQCESRDDVLILRGRVSTFFMKQLAQERIRSIKGVNAVINDLQVVDPISSANFATKASGTDCRFCCTVQNSCQALPGNSMQARLRLAEMHP